MVIRRTHRSRDEQERAFRRQVASKIGNPLFDARMKKGWSQEILGKKSGINPTLICLFERGKRKIAFQTALKLADALSIDFRRLLPETIGKFKDKE